MLGSLWGSWRRGATGPGTGEIAPLAVPSQIEITLEDLAKDVWDNKMTLIDNVRKKAHDLSE